MNLNTKIKWQFRVDSIDWIETWLILVAANHFFPSQVYLSGAKAGVLATLLIGTIELLAIGPSYYAIISLAQQNLFGRTFAINVILIIVLKLALTAFSLELADRLIAGFAIATPRAFAWLWLAIVVVASTQARFSFHAST
ncbi:hypothetical protein IJI17_02440 [Candidatus Saccharibacteria bacterium]|nr:hypothetical protein [Candidatus Saccharibacteria bacterium]